MSNPKKHFLSLLLYKLVRATAPSLYHYRHCITITAAAVAAVTITSTAIWPPLCTIATPALQRPTIVRSSTAAAAAPTVGVGKGEVTVRYE